MYFHASLVGPNGQVYHCEHNHRTETAAVTCANSSATRHMANLAWQRSAVQAAQAAALARQRAAEQARRIAAQQAEAARRAATRQEEAAKRAAAQRAAEETKAAKRAAKLAAMPPRRAWKLMTPEERLIKTAEAELQVYGTIMSAEAKAAYDRRSGMTSTPSCPPQAAQPPPAGDPWWLQPGIRS